MTKLRVSILMEVDKLTTLSSDLAEDKARATVKM